MNWRWIGRVKMAAQNSSPICLEVLLIAMASRLEDEIRELVNWVKRQLVLLRFNQYH